MQTPSKLSMLRLWRFVRYLLGAADVGPFFAYQDEPNTVLVWTDGEWSKNAATCKSTSAGAVQLGSHTVETWSVNQQLVSLSSAESEFYAIGSGCARSERSRHEGSGKRGDGELYEQACNYPREHLARCDRCGTHTSDQREQRCHLWMGVVGNETSGRERGWLSLHIRGECWGRRSCRGYDTGLACGHEQAQWLESADAVQH